jgi:hypothetical protein
MMPSGVYLYLYKKTKSVFRGGATHCGEERLMACQEDMSSFNLVSGIVCLRLEQIRSIELRAVWEVVSLKNTQNYSFS